MNDMLEKKKCVVKKKKYQPSFFRLSVPDAKQAVSHAEL